MKRKINSRAKGARGERAWRDVLRANGFMARRGQQFCGSPDSPDVICEALACLHWEVKNVEKLNIWDALDQARRDAGPSALGVVAFTRNNWPFYVAMRDEIFFRILQHTDLDGLARSLAADLVALRPAVGHGQSPQRELPLGAVVEQTTQEQAVNTQQKKANEHEQCTDTARGRGLRASP